MKNQSYPMWRAAVCASGSIVIAVNALASVVACNCGEIPYQMVAGAFGCPNPGGSCTVLRSIPQGGYCQDEGSPLEGCGEDTVPANAGSSQIATGTCLPPGGTPPDTYCSYGAWTTQPNVSNPFPYQAPYDCSNQCPK
jgi:hypothetical protein